MRGQFIIGFITGTLGLFWLGCGMMPGGDALPPPEVILTGPPTATNHTVLPLPTLETNLTQSPPATVPATDDGVATDNLALQKDQTGHPVEAAALYSKAADLGVPQAQYNLGYLHEHGQAGLQQLAGDATMLFYMTDEAQEGRDAFKEKRKPNFKKYPKLP